MAAGPTQPVAAAPLSGTIPTCYLVLNETPGIGCGRSRRADPVPPRSGSGAPRQLPSRPGRPRRRSRSATSMAQSVGWPFPTRPPRRRCRPFGTSAKNWPMTCGRCPRSFTRCGERALVAVGVVKGGA